MAAIYLIRIGELTLKRENRVFFEKKLKSNIRKCMDVKNVRISGSQGRFYIETPEEHSEQVEHALSHTFGIVSYSRARRVQKDPDIVDRTALKVIRDLVETGDINPDAPRPVTFKVEARRTDKSYPQNSYQIACN